MNRSVILPVKVPGTMSISKVSFSDFCFWFSVFDILFLPYFKWFSISFSVPFIAAWLIANIERVFKRGEGTIVKLMGIAMLASVIISVVYPFDLRIYTSLSTTVKRSIQYFIILGYYLFYVNYFKNRKVRIDKALGYFIFFTAVLALIYQIIPDLYANVKYFLYPADNHTMRYLNNEVEYRFNGLLVDPNNVAYVIDGVMAWLLLKEDIATSKKLLVMVASLFIVLSTASTGGLVAYTIVFALMALRMLEPNILKVKPSAVISIMVFVICAVAVLSQESVQVIIKEKLFTLLQSRVEHYTTRRDVSGGRLSDFVKSLQYMNPLMLVVGIGKEGISFEIGHLYYIGLYGLPAYLGFMWISFRLDRKQRKRDLIWMLPFFIGFTINIAIGEFKWLAIYYLMLAYSRSGLCSEQEIVNIQNRGV